ncbi:MAG: tetratricopeptide repeat protein [Gammaproteobacteria bacterium]
MSRWIGGAGLLASAFLVVSMVAAQENSATIAPATYKLLQAVDGLIEREAYGDALRKLNAGLPEADENSLDQAVILRAMASVHTQHGNYREAATALAKALATKALPRDQARAARWNLGELYAASDQFTQAAELLEAALQEIRSPDSRQLFLIANVYAKTKQLKKSAAYLRKAIARQDKPDPAWYQMLLALYYETGNYQQAVDVLQEMIAKFPPNKEYWLQLIGLYQQMEHYKQALAVNELAYREGLLGSADEILKLANLMSHEDAPYRAAELLEKEIASGRLAATAANWEKVADAWTQAREFSRAVAALKKASEFQASGDLNFRLGQIYVEQEKWGEARRELGEALRKGGLKDPGNAHLLLGISNYELHRNTEARESFARARQYSTTRDSGGQWVHYLDSEG